MIKENICFDEAGVLEFIKYPTAIELKLENVYVDGLIKKAELSFNNVKILEMEHKPVTFPLMAAEFGIIFSLELNDNKAELLIEWHNFQSRETFVKSYFISCDWIDIKIIEPETPPELQNVKIEDLNFHESPCTEQPFTWILKFERNPTSVFLCLDGVKIGQGLQYVELLFEGVKKVEVDNEQTDLPLMASSGGRVVTCTLNDNSIDLVIQWNDFERDILFLRSYFIEFEKVRIVKVL
jgi:hypothetical protein